MSITDNYKNRTGLIISLLITVGFIGCEGFWQQEEVTPFFTAEVEGEGFERAFNGEARFGRFTEPELEEEGVLIQMSSRMPEEGYGILLIGKLDYIPESGSYDIVPFDEEEGMAFGNIEEEEFYGIFLVGALDQENYSDQFESVQGEITINSFESDMLIGEMEFTSAGYKSGSGDNTEIELSIQGAFEALESEIELGDSL